MARRGDGIYQRGKVWYLDFVHEGRRHVVRLGRGINRTVARELASVKRAGILKGEVGIGPKVRNDPTFEQASAEFLKWVNTSKKPRTARGYRNALKHLARSFGGCRLSQIDELSVERHKRTLVEAGHGTAANRQLAILRSLFNRCRDDLKVYDGPTPRMRLVRESPGRLRFLDAAEEQRLLEHVTEPVRTIILVGTHTGLRITSEALALQKQDVDLARGLLTVQTAYAKNGRTRTVPLNRVVRAALARIFEQTPGPFVFARRDGRPLRTIRKPFEAACEAAKLTDVTPHTLRHTFASKLAMAGVDPRTIQELGGWRSLAMVARYTHLSPTHKAEAVERIAENSPTLFTTGPTATTGQRRVSAL
jgi:integrase